MKISKSTRKTKSTPTKPASKKTATPTTPAPLTRQQARIEAARFIHSQVEKARKSRHDIALYSIAEHIALLTCPPEDFIGFIESLPAGKVMRFGISALLYSPHMPDYGIKAANLILNRAVELGPQGNIKELLISALLDLSGEGKKQKKAARKPDAEKKPRPRSRNKEELR